METLKTKTTFNKSKALKLKHQDPRMIQFKQVL